MLIGTINKINFLNKNQYGNVFYGAVGKYKVTYKYSRTIHLYYPVIKKKTVIFGTFTWWKKIDFKDDKGDTLKSHREVQQHSGDSKWFYNWFKRSIEILEEQQ